LLAFMFLAGSNVVTNKCAIILVCSYPSSANVTGCDGWIIDV
jgi:hypothetical protein